jgi:hypothetical protein
MKPLRHERRAFREQNLPYGIFHRINEGGVLNLCPDIANRSHKRGIQNPQGVPSHAMATSEARAILHDTLPTHPGYYGSISIDNHMRGQYPETTYHQDAGRPPVEITSTNTFTNIAGNMTQLHVTSYGESGVLSVYLVYFTSTD